MLVLESEFLIQYSYPVSDIILCILFVNYSIHPHFSFCISSQNSGPQRDFDRVEGILETIVGYSGSSDPEKNKDPTYRNIKDCEYLQLE